MESLFFPYSDPDYCLRHLRLRATILYADCPTSFSLKVFSLALALYIFMLPIILSDNNGYFSRRLEIENSLGFLKAIKIDINRYIDHHGLNGTTHSHSAMFDSV
jgi:hypothetical protein